MSDRKTLAREIARSSRRETDPHSCPHSGGSDDPGISMDLESKRAALVPHHIVYAVEARFRTAKPLVI